MRNGFVYRFFEFTVSYGYVKKIAFRVNNELYQYLHVINTLIWKNAT